MFEPFSSGYYFGRLVVEPHPGERAVIQRATHERVNEQLYATDDGLSRLDHPLVMKLGTRHFPVHGDSEMPAATLGLPSGLLERLGIRNPPTDRPVLLATAERAAQLLRLAGSGPTPIEDGGDHSTDSTTTNGTDGGGIGMDDHNPDDRDRGGDHER